MIITKELIDKINTRAISSLSAFILICSGIYMCFEGLSATGIIDLNTTLISGKIETGSLGLLAMLLGVVIILFINLRKPYEGQKIKITVNGNEIIGEGLSYRKLRELVQATTSVQEK